MAETTDGFLGRKWSQRIGRGLSAVAAQYPWRRAWLSGRRIPDLRLPDFLGIGAQKAGTAWLYRNLAEHPAIFMSAKKELHFFNVNFFRGLRWYSQHFTGADNQIAGEITPAYSILPVSRIRYIRALMPEVRVILILRDPIERAWSRARMNLLMGENAGRSIEDIADAEFIRNFNSRASIARGSYARILDNWLEVFPNEQIFTGFFEDIVEAPQRLLTDIFRFIGVSTDIDWQSLPFNRKIHSSPPIEMPARFRAYLADLYADELIRLEQRFGERIARWRG